MRDKKKLDRVKFRSTIIAIILLCGGSVVSKFLPASERLLDRWDMSVYDFALKKLVVKPASVNDIVVIPITDEGLEYYHDKSLIGWPWPREYYTHLIEFCKAGGAKAVFFDLLFTDYSPYEGDDGVFADKAREWEHIYLLGEFLDQKLENQKASEKREEHRKKFSVPVTIANPLPKEKKVETIRFPVGEIPDAVKRVCDPTIPKDLDGKIRRYGFLTRHGDNYYLSPAIAMLWDAEGNPPITLDKGWLTFGNHRIPIDEEGAMLLKYYGEGCRTYKTYEAHNIIQSGYVMKEGKTPAISPDVVKDKYVFVGTYFPGIDIKDTPVDRFYPGVEIGATAAANILANDYIVEMPKIWVVVMSLVYMVTSCFTFRYVKAFLCKYALYGFIGIHVAITVIAFQHDVWVSFIPQVMAILSSYITSIALNYVYEGKQRQLVKKTFQSYVSPAVVNKILAQSGNLNLDGEKKLVTVLFLDIEGFTTMSEKMTPEDAVKLLNTCFTRFGEEIFATEGNIDKFVGDAVIAFWGDPLLLSDHAVRACRSAVAIQKAMTDLNTENKSQLNIRVGVNTADVIVGNMGSKRQFNYTVIGDGVNFASRLEGANKEFGTKILISDSTYQMAKDGVEAREVGLIRVKGKTQAVHIHEVVGLKGTLGAEERAWLDLYNQGLSEFRKGQYLPARDLFAEAVRKRATPDKLSQKYVDLCNELASSGTKVSGEYIHELKTK